MQLVDRRETPNRLRREMVTDTPAGFFERTGPTTPPAVKILIDSGQKLSALTRFGPGSSRFGPKLIDHGCRPLP
ncbi:MAG: hypothetical protein C0P76_014215 [Acidimicrobiia bacterium]